MRQLNKSIPWRPVEHGFALTIVWFQLKRYRIRVREMLKSTITGKFDKSLCLTYQQQATFLCQSCVTTKILKVFVYGNIIVPLDNIFPLT